MNRYLIFRSKGAREWTCVCSARSEQHALEIARRTLGDYLEASAFAVLEASWKK